MFELFLLWIFIFIFIFYINKENKVKEKELIPLKKRHKKRSILEKIYDKNFSKQDRIEIYIKYEYKCFKCGSKKKLTIDHHMPLSLGYGLDKNNAVLLCEKCNNIKSNKLPNEFYSKKELEKLANEYKIETDYTLKRIRKKELEVNLGNVKKMLKGEESIAFTYLGKKINGIVLGIFEKKDKTFNKKNEIYLKVMEEKEVNLYLLKNIKELYVHNEDKRRK